MATAELSWPQSARVAIWPPHARTVVPSAVAVKVTIILVLLLPAYVPDSEYADVPVIVPL